MSEERTLLIRENKEVAALNRVSGFDPVRLLQKSLQGKKVAGDQLAQMVLKYKKLWFRLACPHGRIRLIARRLTEEIAIIEAEIYRDRSDSTPVANFIGSRTIHDTPGGLYIQAAQYEAIDNVLTDAGFGIQLCDICKTWGEEAYTLPTQDGGAEMRSANENGTKTTPGEAPEAKQEEGGSTAEASVEPRQDTPEKGAVPPQDIQPAEEVTPAEPDAPQEQPAMAAETAQEQTLPATSAASDVEPVHASTLNGGHGQSDTPQEVHPAEESTPQEANMTEQPGQPEEKDEHSEQPEHHGDTYGEQTQQVSRPVGIEIEYRPVDRAEPEAPPVSEESEPVSEADQETEEMTLEEAMNVIADVGSCRGKTLAQIADRRPTTLRWYFTTCPDSSERLKKAARLVFDSLNLPRSA